MSLKLQSTLAFAAIFCASIVQAKTAAEVFEKVSPSVVVIRTYNAQGQNKTLGSGVVLEDGVVVTNCHVIKDSATIQVERQEMKYPATLAQSDWDRDICSLAVNSLKGQAATKGSTSRLKVGDKVYAVGAPQGLQLTLSEGLVASLRPVVGGQYLQISAPISPGSSGGGLFDEGGRLIGLPTFYLAGGQQLNFAVPVEWVNELPKRNASAPKAEQTTSNEWMNKVIELEKKKDWPELVQHALRWTKAEPRDADAWYNLGVVYSDTKQYAKAVEAYQQAIRIDPEYASAWYNLGNAYSDTEQYAKAIETFQQAIRVDPEHAGAWVNLGLAYRRTEQYAKAVEAYQQAIRIKPEHAGAWVNLGAAYFDTEKYAKAVEAFQQAIRIKPESVSAWYNLGVAYKISGQTSKVMEVYKRLKTIDPGKADEFFNEFVSP